LSPKSGPGAPFYQFCDALEVKDGVAASEKGWGLDHALVSWGAYVASSYWKDCEDDFESETSYLPIEDERINEKGLDSDLYHLTFEVLQRREALVLYDKLRDLLSHGPAHFPQLKTSE
jgi:hypothetical protein